MQLETSNGQVTIRPASLDDIGQFRALRLDALQNHSQAFTADYAINKARPLTYWEDRLRSLRSQDGHEELGMIYFAEHAERLVGMCGVQRGESPKTKHTAWIWGVYVREEFRGFRVAERLIEHCTRWARGNGVSSLKLGVTTNNGSAIRCYLRCGFTVYGVEPQAAYADGKMLDELLMVRLVT